MWSIKEEIDREMKGGIEKSSLLDFNVYKSLLNIK